MSWELKKPVKGAKSQAQGVWRGSSWTVLSSQMLSALQKNWRQAGPWHSKCLCSYPGQAATIPTVGSRKCQCASPECQPISLPQPLGGEFWLQLLHEIRLFSFSSSYNRPTSGIQFWLFSGELLKSCFRVWNPSFRHNLEIKGCMQMKNALQLSL